MCVVVLLTIAGLDLIGNEERTNLLGERSDLLEEGLGGEDVSALALGGLDQDGCHLVRAGLLLEQLAQLLHRVAAAIRRAVLALSRDRHRAAVAVGEGRDEHARHRRLEPRAVDVLGGGERPGRDRAPVEPALEHDDGLSPRGRARNLDRVLDRLGARVGEQDLVVGREARRKDLAHLLHQRHQHRRGHAARRRRRADTGAGITRRAGQRQVSRADHRARAGHSSGGG